jgi:hypothetical protein
LEGEREGNMKYNKIPVLISLVYTTVPLISALFAHYTKLPFDADESLFKTFVLVVFILAWCCLYSFITSVSEETLHKLKIVKKAADYLKGYWFIKYENNSYCSCSIVKICDSCEGHTKSYIKDYDFDLTEKESTFGIDNLNFNSDEKLSLIYASGGKRHSFFRTKYSASNYEVIRIVEADDELSVKIIGCMKRVTSDILRDTGICKNEKLAKQMLKTFTLTKENIEQLLLNLHGDNSTFSQTVMNEYHRRVQRFGNFYNTVQESETKPNIESTNSEKIISSK